MVLRLQFILVHDRVQQFSARENVFKECMYKMLLNFAIYVFPKCIYCTCSESLGPALQPAHDLVVLRLFRGRGGAQ